MKSQQWVNYEKVISLYNQDYSYAEIGRMFGVSRQRIYQIVKEVSSASESKEIGFFEKILKKILKIRK